MGKKLKRVVIEGRTDVGEVRNERRGNGCQRKRGRPNGKKKK